MVDYEKIYDGISKAIWGYFFLYFDINLGTISILPSFVGYILFLKAIDLLEEEERELSLLKTLGLILVAWNVIEWLAKCVGYSFGNKWQFVTLIAGLLNMYFHFQFLTNIASIAIKHQEENCAYDKTLLSCRTIQTLMLTVFLVVTNLSFIPEDILIYPTFILAIIYIIVCIYIMATLNGLRKNLKTENIIDNIITDENDTET